MENTQNSKAKTLLRIVVIAIIIIVLILLSIGIVRIVPKMLNSIANASLSMGSLFNTRSATTTTQTGSNGTTNSTTTVTGTVATSTTGGFSIRDLTNLPTQGGNNYVPPAGGPSSNTNTNTNTNTGAGNSVSTTTTVTNTSNNNSSNSNSANSQASTIGASDIAVEITSKGIIDKNTGRFVATNTFTSSDMIVVKFKIENRGQFATGVWSARVDMPSTNANDKVKLLNNNKSLPAGVAITGEARFNNGIAGSPNFSVAVDTGNSTQDTNRGNNTVSIPLNISNIGGNTGTNYPSYPNTSYPTYTGAADLQIRIISTGMVNQYGQYVANSFARYGEKAAVQFEVSNRGGTATGNWAWRTDITGAAVNTYYSPTEASLAPGAATNFIVGFDTNNLSNYNNGYNYGYSNICNSGPYDIYTGQYIGYRYDCNTNSNGYNYGYTGSNSSGAMNFNIYLDTNNSVYEANENNNSASASVQVGY